RLTETTTDGTLLRQTRLSYSATEHPEDYAEKLYNTPGAGEYATNYTYDFNDRLTRANFGTDSYRVTYTYDSLGRLTKYRPRNGGTSRDTNHSYHSGRYYSALEVIRLPR
ncbi:MAG: hypothetical protein IJJ23_07775, partial [Clostridia bacterium]|nr:hypothetical protein [Clostridia bacterium]